MRDGRDGKSGDCEEGCWVEGGKGGEGEGEGWKRRFGTMDGGRFRVLNNFLRSHFGAESTGDQSEQSHGSLASSNATTTIGTDTIFPFYPYVNK